MLSSLKRVKSEWAVEVLNTKGRLLSPWQIIASLFSQKCFKDLWKIFEILGKQEWEKVSSKLAIPTPSNCSFNIRIGFDTHLLEELKATWTSECVSVCVCVVWYQCHASSITQTGQCAYLSLTLRSILLLIPNPFAVSLTSTPHIKHKHHIPPVNVRVCVQSSQGHRMGVADLPESTLYTSYR